jgi:hypothetical protein
MNMRKFFACCQIFVLTAFFTLPTNSFATPNFDINALPIPGKMLDPSASFNPTLVKGLHLHADNPLRFDFIVDASQKDIDQIEEEGMKLVKYFLGSLTIPESQQWVNLSPYEKSRILPKSFEQTEMGRDLLAQDYLLKQLTASFINPEKDLGKEFWQNVYQKSREQFGTTQIPVNTFNKVWIVADKAKLFAQNNTVYIVDSHLKVMLEEDYLARDAQKSSSKF